MTTQTFTSEDLQLLRQFFNTDSSFNNDLTPIQVLAHRGLCTRDACVVELDVFLNGDVLTVQGTSKRCPDDKPDEELAYLLAYARAFHTLAVKIKRRANGLVKHHDDMREQKPAQRAKTKQYLVTSRRAEPSLRNRLLKRQRTNERSWPNDWKGTMQGGS